MSISRIDLADATSPDRLAIEIFKHEPDLPIPVPIEQLCRKLDIVDICALQTAGYEGGLITDRDKSAGTILYNAQSPQKRRRFTIAHELGHFLMPSHVPTAEGRFLCSQDDMFQLRARDQEQRARMEVEANRFASCILLPARNFRTDVAKSKDPDLQQVAELSRRYDVSKEAVSRAYVEFRDEPTAILIAKDSVIQRTYLTKDKFPFLSVSVGNPVPKRSLLLRRRHDAAIASDLDETDAGVWIDVAWGTKAPTLYEQVYPQHGGYAIILLTIERTNEDEEDRDGERTSKQRYQERIGRWRR